MKILETKQRGIKMKCENMTLNLSFKEVNAIWCAINRYLVGEDQVSGRLGTYCGARGIKSKEELMNSIYASSKSDIYFLIEAERKLHTLRDGFDTHQYQKEFIEGLDDKLFTNPNNPTDFAIVKVK